MSKQKQKISRPKTDEEEFEEYLELRKQARKTFWKRVGIIIVCVALVFAFCLPAIGTLLS